MIFNDMEQLNIYLRQDSGRTSLNPIRFVCVESITTWIEAKKILLSLADETMPLSGFCENDDTMPNIKSMSTALKRVKRSQLVFPLAEYLRLYPEKTEQTVRNLIKADYQNNTDGKLRLYFLMYRMNELLKSYSSDDPRASECVCLLNTASDLDYRLTFIQKDLCISLPGNEVIGFKKYLEYWETNPEKSTIIRTANAIYFKNSRLLDNINVIISPYDLLKQQFGLPTVIKESFGSPTNWDELAKVMVGLGSFERTCQTILTVNNFTVALFRRWPNYSSFQKWILWLWAKTRENKSYGIIAAKLSSDLTQFIDKLYCCIFDFIDDIRFSRFYAERKEILSSMQTVPTEEFWRTINSLERPVALSCLTSLTNVEQKYIFEIIAEYTYDRRETILPLLKLVYPQLYYYLANDENPNQANLSIEQQKYFAEYKWLKATDSVTETFVSLVHSVALKKGISVFSMRNRNYYITQNYDENTAILFVDGMGVEYIDYLAYLFSDLDEHEYSVTFNAGYCMLPSVTEFNKDFLDGRNTVELPIRELDELKHANSVHPDSLIGQFRILDSLKDRVISLFSKGLERLIVTSDHGTSRLAVKVRNTKFDNVYLKPKNLNVYRYGRYCDNAEEESNYATAINYNHYLIFADYSRFVQSGAPIDEIHGGASLEEWLVPVITIERCPLKENNSIHVSPKYTKYKPEFETKKITVKFTLNETKKRSLQAKIKGRNYQCLFNNGDYSFDFIPAKSDAKLKITIIDKVIIGEFTIEIEQGIKKNKNFDI